MVEAETFNSREKAIIRCLVLPRISSADFQGILLFKRNQIVCHVSFFLPQPRSLHRNSPVHAWLFLQCSGSTERQPSSPYFDGRRGSS